MRNLLVGTCLVVASIPSFLFSAPAADSAPWHHPLYLGNNDYWRMRIPVVVKNNTDLTLNAVPVSIRIGADKGELAIVDVSVESIRVVNAAGDEMMFRVNAPDGSLLERGVTPGGGSLTFPSEAHAGQERLYFVYFDNPSAWPVADYFSAERTVANGSFEENGRYGPRNWILDWPEERRVVKWSDTVARSGQRSLMLSSEIESSEHPYGARQMRMYLAPGVSYKIEAWVKGEGISGAAGLGYMPESQEMNITGFVRQPGRLLVDQGTFDWKKVEAEFTAPTKATVLAIETFMEGTGTLWIDDVQVVPSIDYAVETTVLPAEKAPLVQIGASEDWFPGDVDPWPLRAAIKVANPLDHTLKGQSVRVDLEQLLNRLHGEIDEDSLLQLTDGVEPIPYVKLGESILFNQDIPARTLRWYYLYMSPAVRDWAASVVTYDTLSGAVDNRVANAEFEANGFADWQVFGRGINFDVSVVKDDGNSVLQIAYGSEVGASVIEAAETGEEIEDGCGVKQRFSVVPGTSYFFGARVKGSDFLKHSFRVRAVFMDRDGEQIGDWDELSIHQDRLIVDEWRYLTMAVEVPPEAAEVEIRLVKTGPGKAWFDDIVFAEAISATTSVLSLERHDALGLKGLAVWEENPITKVFPDNLPMQELDEVRTTVARNEVEPVQLALRSDEALDALEIRVVNPRNADGQELDQVEIGIVGYVPIDYPSKYHTDDHSPYWHMRLPGGRVDSDGWAGWWPDPILPRTTIDLPAHETHCAWIEVSVPTDAHPGEYSGRIQIKNHGETIKDLPWAVLVRDFELPENSSVNAVYDVRFRERQRYGSSLTEQEHYQAVWKFLKEHRLSAETIRPSPVWEMKDGEVTADFTEFDKAASYYFDELGFQTAYTPWDFFTFGWSHPPRDFLGVAPYPGERPFEGVDRGRLSPEYVHTYQSALRIYWEHMKEKGWADKVLMYLADEPVPGPEIEKQTKALCDMIHAVDPEIPIYVSVWWYRPEYDGYIDAWGVSHRGGAWGHHVPVEHLKAIAERGEKMVFTTDGMQCTDTPYLAFERLMPHFCFKYKAHTYEFWGSNWQSVDPYDYGWHSYHRHSSAPGKYRWMRFPNGDGYCIYPGLPVGVDHMVPSTRLKQAREGVEDFEYFKILQDLIEARKAEGKSADAAEAVFAQAMELVTNPTGDGRFSTLYMRSPDAVLVARDKVGAMIEQLLVEK